MSELTVEQPPEHPVQLTVEDDLHRNRLTVAFRLILLIPHIIWVVLWSIAVFFAAIANWVAALVTGRPPAGLHRFLSAYVRYRVHLGAYAGMTANPYPGFVGEEGEYPIDVRLPGPEPQSRWKVFFRLILWVPAWLIAGVLAGGSVGVPLFWTASGRNRRSEGGGGGFGGLVGGVCGFLGWFASIVLGRMPKGLRDAGAYGLGYGAQSRAYLLLLTERYPNADPTAILRTVQPPPVHPVHLVGEAHDLRRSRVTTFFRLPLAIPHLIWWYLWGWVVEIVVFLNWFVTLISGSPYAPFHRFVAAYVRYSLHFGAFLTLAANPFPGFVGDPGRYPLDLELPGPERQNRWVTAFRIILAIPAALVTTALAIGLFVAAILMWFASLATGRAPWGLRNFAAYSLRYWSQYSAYRYLVTDRYPHASPLEGAAEPQVADEAAVVAA
jgi:hypothetical protein